MKRVLRCMATAGIVASLFAPLGARAVYDCVTATGTPASVCAYDRAARSVFIRFVKGPATVIVEAESRVGQQPGTFVCVKVFLRSTFAMNCSTSIAFSIDDTLGTARIAGSFLHPKYGTIALDITSTAVGGSPHLHKEQTRQSVVAFCDVGFTQTEAPRIARDAGAVGYVAFKRVLGRFAAPSTAPAPASHRMTYVASLGVGFGAAACNGSSAPDWTLYRLLTCHRPVCAGLERGALVVATGARSRITLMALHENGTKTIDRAQQQQPSIQPDPGMDCVSVAHKVRNGRWYEGGYSWCEPGLLNAVVDPALRTATMKASVQTPDVGRLDIDLSFASSNDPGLRYRPTSFVTVNCWGAYGHTETALRENQAVVTGSVRGTRFPSLRFSGGAPLRGLLWNKAYVTQWVDDRGIPSQC